MRTKTLLLTAALGIIGAASSMAQVYSVNSVGYINLTMPAGFSLVANQLNATPNNSLNSVLPGVPIESQVLKFVSNNYVVDVYDGSAWLDNNTGLPSTSAVAPGEGFFFYHPTGGTVTLVGEVPQGDVSVPLASGFSLISSKVPQRIDLTAANGFPQTVEAQYLTFNAGTQNYNTILINDGTQWLNNDSGLPEMATPDVGTGFFYYNPPGGASSWPRTFSVNP